MPQHVTGHTLAAWDVGTDEENTLRADGFPTLVQHDLCVVLLHNKIFQAQRQAVDTEKQTETGHRQKVHASIELLAFVQDELHA